MLDGAEQDFGARSSVIDNGWIAGVLSHLPGIDRQVDGGARPAPRGGGWDQPRARPAPRAPGPAQRLQRGGSGVIKELASLGDTERTVISRAIKDLGSLDAAVAGIPSGSLFGPLDRLRTDAEKARQSLDGPVRAGLTILQTLPRIAGAGTHRYLLMLTNPGEERAGGGYVGAVGTVVFQDGQLASSNFMSSTFSDKLVTTFRRRRPSSRSPAPPSCWGIPTGRPTFQPQRHSRPSSTRAPPGCPSTA